MTKDKAFKELHKLVHSKMRSLVIYNGEFTIQDLTKNPYYRSFFKYIYPCKVRGEIYWYCENESDNRIKKALTEMEVMK